MIFHIRFILNVSALDCDMIQTKFPDQYSLHE